MKCSNTKFVPGKEQAALLQQFPGRYVAVFALSLVSEVHWLVARRLCVGLDGRRALAWGAAKAFVRSAHGSMGSLTVRLG
jgi:hypothetical protein